MSTDSISQQRMIHYFRMHKHQIRRMCAWLYGLYLIITIFITLQFYYQIHFILHGLLSIFVPFTVIISQQPKFEFSPKLITAHIFDKRLQTKLLCIGLCHIIISDCFYYICEIGCNLFILNLILSLIYIILILTVLIKCKMPNKYAQKHTINRVKIKMNENKHAQKKKHKINQNQSPLIQSVKHQSNYNPHKEYKQLQHKFAQLQKKYESIQQSTNCSITKLRKQLQESKKQITNQTLIIRDLKFDRNTLEKKNEFESHKKYQQFVVQMSDELQSLHEQMSEFRHKNEALEHEKHVLQKENETLQQKQNVLQNQNDTLHAQQTQNVSQNENDTLQQKQNILQKENEALKDKIHKIEQQTNEQINSIQTEYKQIQTDKKRLETQLKDVKQANKYYHDVLSTMTSMKSERKKLNQETKLSNKELNLLVCKQYNYGWKVLLSDNTRRSFAGYKRNPFSARELHKWWQLITTTGFIQWNRPQGFPRKCAWFVSSECKCCYRYSSTLWQPNVFPLWFDEITARVLNETGLQFEHAPNSCNVNWYNDGCDSVGWHSDDETLFNSLHEDTLIVSLSLGKERKFEVKLMSDKSVDDDSDNIKDILLYNGDIMTMEGLFQKHYLHRVPKQYEVDDARINLTWRWIKKHSKMRDNCNAKTYPQIVAKRG